jgi:TonB-linked SusC/RagA family outer membrane protein
MAGAQSTTQSTTQGAAQPAVGRARLAGVVTDGTTDQPLQGVTVRVVGTSYAALTGADGRYTILNAAPGLYNIEARRIGYSLGRVDNRRLVADSVVTLNFELTDNPLRLQNVVVSASVDATQGVKTPFTATTLTAADMPVPPNMSVAGMVQGKIAGVNIIRARGPGAGVQVQIRTPTSQEKTNSPIYVVDGVVLNTQTGVTTRDLEALDVASIEVIKGSAATSLYGSLGANGVVAITTNRGSNLALNSTQFTMRTEAGRNQYFRLPERPLYHAFRVNDRGAWVNAAGRDTNRLGRLSETIPFKDNPYVGQTYDQVGQFLSAGASQSLNLQVAQNLASTNFAVSYSRTHDQGLVESSNGWLRQNIRVNVDHRRGEKFNLGVSAYHARAVDDQTPLTWSDFYSIDPDVDLGLRGPDGRVAVLPDSASTTVNPIYRQETYQDRVSHRARTLLNANAGYKVTSQISLRADINYDRSDQRYEDFIPRGILGTDGQTPTLGYFERENDNVEGINASATATWTDQFGRFTPRFTLQALSRRETNPFTEAVAQDFSVSGVRDLDVGQTRTITSSFTDTRLQSGIAALNLDFADKLIGDFSVSREQNSLFGADARTNNWYRASGAYRMAEESWWPFASVNEFKLRYSVGTAGSRPEFYDQYETISLATGGLPTRQTLGNRNLRPEVSREQEVGIDAIVRNRVSLSLVYAVRNNRDQIVSMPLPGLSGFNDQWQNAGRTDGRTLEAEMQAQLMRRGSFSWELNANASRSRTRLVQFNRACYTDAIAFRCAGANLDEMWGNRFAQSLGQLPAVHASSLGQFQVNDDGYVVAVGSGNSWRDGVAKNLWGTTVRVDGQSYAWGRPILMKDSTGANLLDRIGRSFPDLNYGFQNTVRWRGVQLYGLVTGQIGGDVYNLQKRTLYGSTDHNDVVQVGKSDDTKKPNQYYSAADGLFGPGSYNSHFVENGTYAKLSELSLRYTLPQRLLSRVARLGADRAALEVVGRNLFVLTDYTGMDPEAGTVLRRVEGSDFPAIRSYTAALTFAF